MAGYGLAPAEIESRVGAAAFAARRELEEWLADFSPSALTFYDQATTYHDGKWVMLEIHDNTLVDDAKRMVL